MKRVKVNTAAPPVDATSVITVHRMYTVALGNHVVVRFTSRREALAFQAEATRFATGCVQELNLLLADTYLSYRLAWPILSHKVNLGRILRDAEEALDGAVLPRSTQNAVYLQWRAMDRCCASLRAIAIHLLELYVMKTYAVPRVQMEVLLRRCNELSEALRSYGTEHKEATGHIRI